VLYSEMSDGDSPRAEAVALGLDLLQGREMITSLRRGADRGGVRTEVRTVSVGPPRDEPMAVALIDYLRTKNFAALAVVLDEEAERIRGELERPLTEGDLTAAGFGWEVETYSFRLGQLHLVQEYPSGWSWYVHGIRSRPIATVREFRALLALNLHVGP
jgi:hypothetical protein